MDQRDLLTELGDALRQAATAQAAAYRDYGTLLDGFAKRDVPAVEFGRKSLDIYISGLSGTATAATAGAGSLVDGALRGVGIVRKRLGNVVAEQPVAGRTAAATESSRRPPRARALDRKPSRAAKPKAPAKAATGES